MFGKNKKNVNITGEMMDVAGYSVPKIQPAPKPQPQQVQPQPMKQPTQSQTVSIQQMQAPVPQQVVSQAPSTAPKQGSSTIGNQVSSKVKENVLNPMVDFFTADPNKQKVLAATQDHLDIYDIRDNIILLKNGDVSMIVETTAVNFQLLSNFEQDLKIQAFSELINSLNFEMQVVIHTEPIDMRRYLSYLEENLKRITGEGLKKQMVLYIDFVKNLVVQNNILQKRFFVVIPHRSGLLTADQVNPLQKLIDVILGRKRITELKDADKLVEKALIQLNPKRDHVMKMLSRMGLGSKQLNNKELVSLFYSYYNPVDHF